MNWINYLSRLKEENARGLGLLGPDYDYGFVGELDKRGHGTDKGKLPNHITFSTQSFYSNPEKGLAGGVWSKDFVKKMLSNENRDVFTPTQRMIEENGRNNYREYFKNVEKGARLDLGR